MLQELQDIGLSEKEAKVYAAALEIGRATADQLAKHSKIVRSTTYVQIEALMQKGLMSTYEEGKKTYYAPESPELLNRLLARQRETLENKEKDLGEFLPELVRQFESAGERPVVRYFPGKEGVTSVREEALNLKTKETCAIFSYVQLAKLYPEKELSDYSDRRKKLGIRSRAIQVQQAFFQKAEIGTLTERRFLPLTSLTINLFVFDDKVAILSLRGKPFALIIQSSQIASSIMSIFEFLWTQAITPESLAHK